MEEETRRTYKIEIGDEIIINRRDVKEYTFYSTMVNKKNKDGTTTQLEKKLIFAGKPDIPNGTKIKILEMFEDGYLPPNTYNVIWELVITNYQVVDTIDSASAYNEYNDAVADFDINELDCPKVQDSDLPF